MIRAMNQPVTIDTSFANHAGLVPTAAIPGKTFPAIQLTGMVLIRMAALAQIGHAYLEEICVRRAVRIVAIGAVLAYRGVLPQERPSFFRVTAIAGIINRSSLQ